MFEVGNNHRLFPTQSCGTGLRPVPLNYIIAICDLLNICDFKEYDHFVEYKSCFTDDFDEVIADFLTQKIKN